MSRSSVLHSTEQIHLEQPQQLEDVSSADETFVDHVEEVRVLQSSCNPFLVIELFVHCSFCGMGTGCDVDVHLETPSVIIQSLTQLQKAMFAPFTPALDSSSAETGMFCYHS